MEPFLGDCKHDVDQDRNPYLRLHRILGISEERLDPQGLLVSPKEESDLPPLLIEEGYRGRRCSLEDGKNRWLGKPVSSCFRGREIGRDGVVVVMLGRVDARQHDGLGGVEGVRRMLQLKCKRIVDVKAPGRTGSGPVRSPRRCDSRGSRRPWPILSDRNSSRMLGS